MSEPLDLEPSPADAPPAAAPPFGFDRIAVLLGSALIILSPILTWASVGKVLSVSGLDAGAYGYSVLAAGIVSLLTGLHLLTGRIVPRRWDTWVPLVGLLAVIVAAAVLVYVGIRIAQGVGAASKAARDGGVSGSLLGALKPAVGPGIYIGLVGCLLAVVPWVLASLAGRARQSGVIVAATAGVLVLAGSVTTVALSHTGKASTGAAPAVTLPTDFPTDFASNLPTDTPTGNASCGVIKAGAANAVRLVSEVNTGNAGDLPSSLSATQESIRVSIDQATGSLHDDGQKLSDALTLVREAVIAGGQSTAGPIQQVLDAQTAIEGDCP